MKREETERLEELSLECFGKKNEWRKLTTKGLVMERRCVNPRGPKPPAFTARRIPLTANGAMHYMEKTLEMRQKIKEEKEQVNASGSESNGESK